MTGPTHLSIFKTGRWVSYEHALKFTISECLQDIEQSLLLCSIVFRPAWWSARSKTWFFSFDRVIRLVGSIFFYINQNDVVLVKKKVNGLQPSFWPGFAGSHRVFSYPIFSSTRSGSSPGSARSTRRAGPGFKTMLCRVDSISQYWVL